MTGGIPKLRSYKSLTSMTFDIWFSHLTFDIWHLTFNIGHSSNGPMDQWTNGLMDHPANNHHDDHHQCWKVLAVLAFDISNPCHGLWCNENVLPCMKIRDPCPCNKNLRVKEFHDLFLMPTWRWPSRWCQIDFYAKDLSFDDKDFLMPDSFDAKD